MLARLSPGPPGRRCVCWCAPGCRPNTQPALERSSLRATPPPRCGDGALIIAVVQFLRTVLMYVQRKTAEAQKQNRALKGPGPPGGG